jgi:hypothetical protein
MLFSNGFEGLVAYQAAALRILGAALSQRDFHRAILFFAL